MVEMLQTDLVFPQQGLERVRLAEPAGHERHPRPRLFSEGVLNTSRQTKHRLRRVNDGESII